MQEWYSFATFLIDSINLDQTGIKHLPAGDWIMATGGSRGVEVTGLADKCQIIATFAASLDDTFLPMQIVYQEKTGCSHPNYNFPDIFDIFHTPSHWANEEICIRFFQNNLSICQEGQGRNRGTITDSHISDEQLQQQEDHFPA